MKVYELLNEVVKTTHDKNKRDVKDVTDAGLLIAKLGAIKSGEQAKEWGAKAKGVPTSAVKTALESANKAWGRLEATQYDKPERGVAFDAWKDAGSALCSALEKIMDKSLEKAAKSGNKIRRTSLNNMSTARDFANAWVDKTA